MRLGILLIGILVALRSMIAATPQRELGCVSISNAPEYVGIPADVDIYEIRVIHAASDSIEALMGGDGLKRQMFISKDQGLHWKPSAIAKGSLDGLSAVSGASRSAILYRSLNNGMEILRSSDGGSTWAPAKLAVRGMEHERGFEISISGISDGGATLYGRIQRRIDRGPIGFERISGIYVSRDYGDNWEQSSLRLLDDSPVAIGERNRDLLFGVNKDGLVRSVDGGQTWLPVGEQGELRRPLVLKGRQTEIRKLMSSGQVVPENLKKGLPNEVIEIEVTEDNHTVYVVTSGGLMISHDLGMSWCRSEVGGNVRDIINGLAIVPGNVADIYVSSRRTEDRLSTVYHSTDAGRHFRVVYAAADRSAHR
ncbi:MAG: hypothetical protein WAM85_23430 [Terracidiphilus sp.]